jgi:hypothetical protein
MDNALFVKENDVSFTCLESGSFNSKKLSMNSPMDFMNQITHFQQIFLLKTRRKIKYTT